MAILKIICCVVENISEDPLTYKAFVITYLVENINTGYKVIPMLPTRYHKIHQCITNIQSKHICFQFFFINFR